MDKRFYGQYRFALYHGAYRDKAEHTVDEDIAVAENIKERAKQLMGWSDEEAVPTQLSFMTEAALLAGQGRHVFIDPDTEAVIRKSIRHVTMEDIRVADLKHTMIGVVYSTSEEPVLFNITDGILRTLVVNMESIGNFMAGGEGEDWMYGPLSNNRTVGTVHGHRPAAEVPGAQGSMDRLKRAGQLVIGMLLMAKSFPEMFHDGPPERIKNPNWYKKVSNASHLQVASVRSSVSPHIRSGHFRVLSHPRYVKKRGQVIFVKPSMVKGKANHTEEHEH